MDESPSYSGDPHDAVRKKLLKRSLLLAAWRPNCPTEHIPEI
jgi:hypothetical protein